MAPDLAAQLNFNFYKIGFLFEKAEFGSNHVNIASDPGHSSPWLCGCHCTVQGELYWSYCVTLLGSPTQEIRDVVSVSV